MKLEAYLNKKPLYYTHIDYDRFPMAYESVRNHLPKPKIIHIVGTNAKGSTGRFLANALYLAGKKTAHYTSPHILRFNERIWLNGSDIDDKSLESAHEKLQSFLDRDISDSLSYFEYTTLLAMMAFSECEYVVLEAGLGGEYDATAVFDKVLSIFTPIDFDHISFLGDTIAQIATTKLNTMRDLAILGYQSHSEVVDIAKNIATKNATTLYMLDDVVDSNIISISNTQNGYMRDNLFLAASAFKLLGLEPKIEYFKTAPLFGRLSKIADNITLDVGHNAQAASAIAKAFNGKKVVLIYNSYSDKDYVEILKILKPIIKRVEIIAVDEERIAPKESLENTLKELNILYSDFISININDEYLVFGSFSVAESFLKSY